MGRRTKIKEREILPDPKYKSILISKFINKMMVDGKKSKAERILHGAFEVISAKMKKDPLEVFEKAIENVKPQIEVKSKRVGGSTYQVPMEVPVKKQNSLAMKWIIGFARNRNEKTMAEKLAGEFMDAFNKTGNTIKKKDDTHRMAEANKAFAYFKFS
jgi:small subunit ribosomal protein S7